MPPPPPFFFFKSGTQAGTSHLKLLLVVFPGEMGKGAPAPLRPSGSVTKPEVALPREDGIVL